LELKRLKRALRQVLILPIIACLVLAGVLVWQVAGSEKTVIMIERSDQRIALATQIEKLVVDEETGLRGYQVTSDTRFLQPYQSAEVPMQQKISDLQSILTRPDQQQILKQFVAEHQLWRQGFAEPLIAIIAGGGQARDDDINLTGRARMNTMRSLLDTIIQNSQDSRTERISQSRQQDFHVFVVLFVLALAIGILIGLFTRNRLESVNAAFRHSLDLQHRRAEELFDSEQNLRTTLASIGDGVISCNLEGQVQIMNPVAQELTGWLESQALNRPLAEVFKIVDEISRAPVETPVDKVLRLNRVVGTANHTVLVRKDGSEVAIDDSGAPIRNAAGELTGVVMVFRDITMERRTRAALLANEKLAVAGRLAATIAHEIHNPLDSVANLLYLLKHDPQDSEAGHFLDIAQSELARVTQISRAMLSLYRESKAPVPVNLKEMLDDLLLLMVGRFQSLGVHISADLPPNIAIDGFPAELRQVFTNLITNAAEAAGEGGHVTIVVTPENAGTDIYGHRHEAGATVTISDDGPGITQEVHDRLFQPFFTTKGERGTGLGLWVSQGIVRKHGGILRLESRNDGTAHGAIASVFLASKPTIDPGGD
jgi:PAS domain S-box-containing protein